MFELLSHIPLIALQTNTRVSKTFYTPTIIVRIIVNSLRSTILLTLILSNSIKNVIFT